MLKGQLNATKASSGSVSRISETGATKEADAITRNVHQLQRLVQADKAEMKRLSENMEAYLWTAIDGYIRQGMHARGSALYRQLPAHI